MSRETPSVDLTLDRLRALAAWEEGGPAWYRDGAWKGYAGHEFDVMRALAEELLAAREAAAERGKP